MIVRTSKGWEVRSLIEIKLPISDVDTGGER